MKSIINEIGNSLQSKNWYSALILSLIVPDICPKLNGSTEGSTKRYPKWFNKYLGKKYQNFLSGDDCYSLRCAYLHEGSSDIELQRARDILDRFVFISEGPHCNKFNNCYFGDPRYDGKNFLQLSTHQFCQDMIEATKQWLKDVEDNKLVQENMAKMLEIHEGEFSIGRAVRFK